MPEEPGRIRAVLDTNLIIRGFLRPGGVSGRLLDLLAEAAFGLVTSEILLDELAATMRQPRLQRLGPFSEEEIERMVRVVRRVAVRVVPGNYDVDVVPTDVRDNPVVACALEGEARFLVTDDRRDLLPLKTVRFAGLLPVEIVSAPGFLRILRAR